jgi:hypothetical protein
VLVGTAGVVRQHEAAAATGGDSVVLVWNQQVLNAIAETRTGPTVAARALAVTHTAIYDAWAAYDPVAVGTRLGGALRQPAAERTVDNKSRAVSFAAYAALVELFPARQATFAQTMAARHAVDGSDTWIAARRGNNAAQAVLDFRHRDGSNQLGDEPGGMPGVAHLTPATSLTPERGPQADRWRRWPAAAAAGATECTEDPDVPDPAGDRALFALTSGPSAVPVPDKDGKLNGQFVDQVDKMIQYPADDTRKTGCRVLGGRPGQDPPGTGTARPVGGPPRRPHPLDRCPMFRAPPPAMKNQPDAKAPDSVRRSRRCGTCTGARSRRGRTALVLLHQRWWIPYRPPNDPAPPFGEYASGPSPFSAAAAEVLTAFTGRGNFELKVPIAAGSSKIEPGAVPAKAITLSWTNFRYAAEQAGLSRQYGGLHFEHGDKDARAAGAKVGINAWAKAVTYFNGSAG